MSNAWDVSDDGSVVVGYSKTTSGNEAFIWDGDHGMRRLWDVLVNNFSLDLTDWTLTGAYGISDDGLTIVGAGINPGGNTEAWIAEVPEPCTLSMLGLGMFALVRRRRLLRDYSL